MTLTSSSKLYIFEIAVYLLILPLSFFLGWRHGRSAFLGYFYLNIFCTVRIVADIIAVLPSNQNAAHPTISSAILSSIGLSPLMLALSGFAHEAHTRLVKAKHPKHQASKIQRWLWFAQAQVHVAAGLGMVLVIIGTIKLVKPSHPLTQSETDHDDKLRSGGALILLVLWVAFTHYALYLLRVARTSYPTSPIRLSLPESLSCIVIAALFVGVRSVYTVVYTFDHKDSKLSPMTGALWVKVVFVVLVPMGAVVGMSVSGWISRDVASKNVVTPPETYDDTYKSAGASFEEVMPRGSH